MVLNRQRASNFIELAVGDLSRFNAALKFAMQSYMGNPAILSKRSICGYSMSYASGSVLLFRVQRLVNDRRMDRRRCKPNRQPFGGNVVCLIPLALVTGGSRMHDLTFMFSHLFPLPCRTIAFYACFCCFHVLSTLCGRRVG